MSGPSNQGVPSDGVTRNSALTFLASAQVQNPVEPKKTTNLPQNDTSTPNMTIPQAMVPPGVKALLDACTSLYPNQPNPLQVTTRLKYWLGGSDPLDYISMYWNDGDEALRVPPHWHYISFGLSDLHGDGRVHTLYGQGLTGPSGSGSELTLRVAAAPSTPPPLWPAALLQAMARYIMTTGNKLCAGDHISWHTPLDGTATSRIKHLLVAEDPKLTTITTPHGTVDFLQLVGCTGRELRAAQRGSGFEVLQLLRTDAKCGDPYLVTKSTRRYSVRGLASSNVTTLAPLAGVSSLVRWKVWSDYVDTNVEESKDFSKTIQEEIKQTLKRGLCSMGERGQEGHMSTDSFEMSSIEKALPQLPEVMEGSWRSDISEVNRVQYLPSIHLIFSPEAASLLPLAINGRIKPGAHFTWRNVDCVTLLSPRVTHAFVTPLKPIAICDNWLQILIPDKLAEDMSRKITHLAKLADTASETDSETDGASNKPHGDPTSEPLSFSWPEFKIKISVGL